jgi:hypothetical protein
MKDDSEFLQEIREEEQALGLILKRVCNLKDLNENFKEVISYRIAEILITSKNLYTSVFSDFLKREPSNTEAILESLVEMRMSFLHLRDLIDDFEFSFLKALEKEEDEETKDEGR